MIDFIEQITSAAVQRSFLPLKLLTIILSILSGGFLIFAYRKTSWMRTSVLANLKEFSNMKSVEESESERKWQKIKQRLEKDWASESKLAIIEADKLLDGMLKRMGYGGESIGDRLKQVNKETLPNLDDVWLAHKTRNDIVHDPDYQFSSRSARIAIDTYEKAFEHLRNI